MTLQQRIWKLEENLTELSVWVSLIVDGLDFSVYEMCCYWTTLKWRRGNERDGTCEIDFDIQHSLFQVIYPVQWSMRTCLVSTLLDLIGSHNSTPTTPKPIILETRQLLQRLELELEWWNDRMIE